MSFFKNIFGEKKRKTPFEIGKFGVDMHSHLIPGIDDGSPSMDHTIAMLAKFEYWGYRKIITTPHILSEIHPNTSDIIRAGLEDVHKEMKRIGMKIELEAAAEYNCEANFIKLIEKKDILTFGDNYVLMEFGFLSPCHYESKALFELQIAGYVPVIAHYERYPFFYGDMDKVAKLRDRNIQIQVNLSSLTGNYGPIVQKMAEKLINTNNVDFLATDCHRMEHLMVLEENLDLPIFNKIEQLILKNNTL